MVSGTLMPLYDKKETCPICDHSFTTKKVRSRFIKLDYTDSDFCPYYKDEEISPLLYYVRVCPNCGYSFTESFTDYFPNGTKEAIQQEITSKWVPHDFSQERTLKEAIQTYKLALLSGKLKKERAIVLAGLLIRIAWLYRKLGNQKEEQRFLKMAYDEYKQAYSEGNYSSSEMTDIRLLYLLGELNRRLDNEKEAVFYFSKVIDKKSSTIEQKIVDMAREQWYVIREKQKQENEDDNAIE